MENPKNLSIKELEAKLLTTTLQDVDVAVINGNYAIGAGLKFSEALSPATLTRWVPLSSLKLFM